MPRYAMGATLASGGGGVAPPVAVADTGTVQQGAAPITINVLTNDTGLPGSPVVSLVSNPGGFSVVGTTVQFDPAGYTQSQSPIVGSYSVSGSNTANITVTITAPPAGSDFVTSADLTASGAGPFWHARLGETSGTVVTARKGTPAGTYFNTADIGYVRPGMTGAGSASKRLGGAAAPGYFNVANPAPDATTLTIAAVVQIDQLVGKMTVASVGNGGFAGQFSAEIELDGVGGYRPRMWRSAGAVVDAAGTPVVFRGSANGTIPVGPAFMPFYRWNSTGGQTIRIGGVNLGLTLVSGTPPAAWVRPPIDDWHFGVWEDTTSSPIRGLLSEVMIWKSYLSDTDCDAIAAYVVNAAYLPAAHDAGSTQVSTSATIDLVPLANPKVGFTPSIVAQGTLGTASVNGLTIQYAAGATAGDNDSFQVRITNGGVQSQIMTVTIDVTAAAGGGDWVPPTLLVPPPALGENMTWYNGTNALYRNDDSIWTGV